MKNLEPLVSLTNAGFRTYDGPVFENLNLELFPGEILGILGANGAGKTLLARMAAGDLPLAAEDPRDEPGGWGLRTASPELQEGEAVWISFGMQNTILAAERARDDSDFLGGMTDPGRSLETLICQGAGVERPSGLSREQRAHLDLLLNRFSLTGLKDRGLRFLSTGEFRKTLICRALFSGPRVLLLDEPFAGLDVRSRSELREILSEPQAAGAALVILAGRGGDLPPSCSRAAVLAEGTFRLFSDLSGAREAYAGLSRRESLDLEGFVREIEVETDARDAGGEAGDLLVEMKNVSVRFSGTSVLEGITWSVRRGEHWQIAGPNGAGKSTLLSLINGDSPKAYGQEISLFGRRRGSGETVWEIKQRIGFVSGGFHMGYLGNQKVLAVVLSGFFDSVGLYDRPTPTQKETALLWCRRLDLESFTDQLFGELSFGVQRTVLLARAMIKNPELLILDEPCQGLDDAHTGVVLQAVEYIASRNHSTVLYVSHEEELKLPSIRRRLELVPRPEGGSSGRILLVP